jgi:hypothetical protein
MHKRRKVSLSTEMVITIKTIVMDTKKLSLRTTATSNLAIYQANVHDVEKKMKAYEDKIVVLENQVNYYKLSKYEVCISLTMHLKCKMN